MGPKGSSGKTTNTNATVVASGQYTDLDTQLNGKFEENKLVYYKVADLAVTGGYPASMTTAYNIPVLSGTSLCTLNMDGLTVAQNPSPTSTSYILLLYRGWKDCGGSSEQQTPPINFSVNNKSKKVIGTGKFEAYMDMSPVYGPKSASEEINDWIKIEGDSTKLILDDKTACTIPKEDITDIYATIRCESVYNYTTDMTTATLDGYLEYDFNLWVTPTSDNEKIDKNIFAGVVKSVYEKNIKGKIAKIPFTG